MIFRNFRKNLVFRSSNSFTLAEILIVVAIMAALTSFGFVELSQFKSKQNFDTDAQSIVEVINSVQSKAIQQEGGTDWGVRFDNSTSTDYQIFQGSSYATSSVVSGQVLSSATIFTNPASGSYIDLVFAARTGLPKSGSATSVVIKKSSGSDLYIITVSSSGRISKNSETGLVGYWPLDGGTSGSIANNATSSLGDVSGNGNNGIASNVNGTGMAWVTGKSGGAVSLDGVDDYVNIGDKNIADGLNKATWSIWFLEPVISSSGVLWSSWGGVSGNSQIILRKSNSASTDFYVFVADSVSDAGTNYGLTNAAGYSAGSWNNIVIVFDGTQSGNANKLKVYINGQDIGFSSFSGGIPAFLTSPTTKYWAFGKWFLTSGYLFAGYIDDVRIYNRALSATEVLNLYNSY